MTECPICGADMPARSFMNRCHGCYCAMLAAPSLFNVACRFCTWSLDALPSEAAAEQANRRHACTFNKAAALPA